MVSPKLTIKTKDGEVVYEMGFTKGEGNRIIVDYSIK
jgi:hypothetical protein